jgi:putative SOS response-associated peptidase YedK
MCVSKQLEIEFDDFARRFNEKVYKRANVQLPIHFANAFNQPYWPVITSEKPNEIQELRWGFVPAHERDPKAFLGRFHTYNCVSEDAAAKNTWRKAVAEGRRCLVPITGFYEHHWTGTKPKDLKIPYLIQMKNEPIFCLGGLWERDTYTIYTSAAGPLMARIHNSKKRQVVIILREREADWLNPNLSTTDALAFCTPINDDLLTYKTIGKGITARGEDPNRPGINDEVLYPGHVLPAATDSIH